MPALQLFIAPMKHSLVIERRDGALRPIEITGEHFLVVFSQKWRL